MGFCEELTANNIDPAKYIVLQNEFITYCRQNLETNSKQVSYREYLERDQLLMTLEKFINRLERELLQKKIKEMSNSSSPL
jgi:hypothetical protein